MRLLLFALLLSLPACRGQFRAQAINGFNFRAMQGHAKAPLQTQAKPLPKTKPAQAPGLPAAHPLY